MEIFSELFKTSEILTGIKSLWNLDIIEKYKKTRKDRNLEEIKLKNGKDLITSFKNEFKDFQEMYNLII